MLEYGFSLGCIFPNKDRIVDSVFIRENVGQKKPVSGHVLRNECFKKLYDGFNETMGMFDSLQGDIGNL